MTASPLWIKEYMRSEQGFACESELVSEIAFTNSLLTPLTNSPSKREPRYHIKWPGFLCLYKKLSFINLCHLRRGSVFPKYLQNECNVRDLWRKRKRNEPKEWGMRMGLVKLELARRFSSPITARHFDLSPKYLIPDISVHRKWWWFDRKANYSSSHKMRTLCNPTAS